MTFGSINKHWILDGREPVAVDLFTWADWFETSGEERLVGLDRVGDLEVSTVFLALDYDFGFRKEPVLFESAVFRIEHEDPSTREEFMDNRRAIYVTRYHTWDEALEGHNRIVGALRLGRSPEALVTSGG